MIGTFLWLRRIHKGFDNAAICLEEVIKSPICIPQCGKCCEANNPLWTTIEAIHAISVLTGRASISKMTSIAEGWLLENNHQLTYDGMVESYVLAKAPEKLVSEWQSLITTQCPFLSQDKTCLIHEVRPLSCRAYGVTRDVNGICPRPLGLHESLSQMMIVDGTPLRKEIGKFREHCKEKNPAWMKSSFVATMLYRAAKPDRFKELISRNVIPSAKLLGSEIDVNLMWQPQVEALRRGLSPDLVAALREGRITE